MIIHLIKVLRARPCYSWVCYKYVCLRCACRVLCETLHSGDGQIQPVQQAGLKSGLMHGGPAVQVKGVATSTGARPWQETDLQQHTWDQFLKACPMPCSHPDGIVMPQDCLKVPLRRC